MTDRTVFRHDHRLRLGGVSTVIQSKAQPNAIEQGLDAGVRDLVEVLDARARLFGIRRELSEATYDYLISKVQLQTVSGGFDYESLRSLDTLYLNKLIDLTKAIGANAVGRSAE